MSETIEVWRYSTAGKLPLSVTVKRDSQPDHGRWRGDTVCESEDCGEWVSDIDPHILETAMPMLCPKCKARSAYPELLWRETMLECRCCGTITCCLVIDPADEWPKHVDCPKCEAQVTVPVIGTALLH